MKWGSPGDNNLGSPEDLSSRENACASWKTPGNREALPCREPVRSRADVSRDTEGRSRTGQPVNTFNSVAQG